MAVLRNELVPAAHVGFVGLVAFRGRDVVGRRSSLCEPCTFVCPTRFVSTLGDFPVRPRESRLDAGDMATGIVIYPACVAFRDDGFVLYSAGDAVVTFDDAVARIVRAVSTAFHDEIADYEMEHAPTESYDFSDDDEDGDAIGEQSSADAGDPPADSGEYYGETGRII